MISWKLDVKIRQQKQLVELKYDSSFIFGANLRFDFCFAESLISEMLAKKKEYSV